MEAFDTEQVQWHEIWNRDSDSDGSTWRTRASDALSPDATEVLTVFAQITPAGKRVVAREFRVRLDTDRVLGYNTIDAVKVHGLDAGGKPLSEYVIPNSLIARCSQLAVD